MRIVPLRARRAQSPQRNNGLFWLLPEAQQRARIRELARILSVETVATIARRSYRDTLAIVEGMPS